MQSRSGNRLINTLTKWDVTGMHYGGCRKRHIGVTGPALQECRYILYFWQVRPFVHLRYAKYHVHAFHQGKNVEIREAM